MGRFAFARPSRTLAALSIPLVLALALTAGCPELFPPVDMGGDEEQTPKGNSGLTGKYVGSTRCSVCHNNIHATWSQTLHARAYETLEKIGQQNNAECVGCHTVGYGEPGGWVDRATTDDLAGVGCEACHGPAADHANNVSDESLRPQINISASVCGRCHTGAHQPNFDDWTLSHHAAVEPLLVPRFASGASPYLNACGKCHSGDYFYHAILQGETVPDTFLQGRTAEQMAGITCAICHNPHARTGNAAAPEDGRDYQLRYPQIKYTTPTNTLAAAQDPSRFNLCGQCHHARQVVWTDSAREPHPSDQVNVFFGEMPLPDSDPTPIVPSRSSVHLNTPEQCSTCHVFRRQAQGGVAPSISGHTFEVNFEACAACHGSKEIGQAKLEGLAAELDFRAELVKEALDEWGTLNNVENKGVLSWEYTSEGGPAAAGQALIPDNIKKARYIYYYVISGGGNGVHNPDYVREALMLALEYVEAELP